MVIKKY